MEKMDWVALVAGGASGLGEATVRRIAAGGATVVVFDRDTDRGHSLAAELGDAVSFVEGDVCDTAQVEGAIDAAAQRGTLRVAVNCAGIGPAAKTVGRDGSPHDLELFQQVVAVNLVGTFNVLRLAAAAIARAAPDEDGQRGVIINTTSIAAFDGQIGQVAYAASKGGVVGITLPTARDLAKLGVRVMCIAPGTFDTPLLGGVLPDKVKQALEASIPNPSRLGRPDEYARLVMAIVTNPYLNGEVIRVDGALRMPPR